jgi:serine/threonine protein kinase
MYRTDVQPSSLLLIYIDVITANILLGLPGIDRYTESDIYRLFGKPEIKSLKTESGEMIGPGAPRNIVKALDFLSSQKNLVNKDIRLVDFNQSFPALLPPENMLGTPVEFLAPEVAVGLQASPGSDIWALGYSIFRIRSGKPLFLGTK